jgi:hypothetical protein
MKNREMKKEYKILNVKYPMLNVEGNTERK